MPAKKTKAAKAKSPKTKAVQAEKETGQEVKPEKTSVFSLPGSL